MTWLLFITITEWAIRIGMVPVILRRRFQPVTSLAWLALIFFLPFLGLVVYLLVGVSYLGRRRARTHQQVIGSSTLPERLAQLYRERPKVLPEQRNMIIQAEQVSGNPILGGNGVQLISDTGELVEMLVQDVDAAEHHVHVLFYIFWPDEVGMRVIDALKRWKRNPRLVEEQGRNARREFESRYTKSQAIDQYYEVIASG